MRNNLQFYIDGTWVQPKGTEVIDVINPADETVVGQVALGDTSDVDAAISAARKAFETYSMTSVEERTSLFDRIIAVYEKRIGDLASAVTDEMGAPQWLAEQLQAPVGVAHFQIARAALEKYRFDEPIGTSEVVREPIGVCALITPWNWPLMLMAAKVAPALAAGCTVVLKPSEIAPFSGTILAEILHEAGVPKGVFNLVHGNGRVVGNALTSHPDVDLVSFTGSTAAGIEVARTGALTVKRIHQELGGKSPNILLRSADLKSAIEGGVAQMMLNSGQSCSAPSRMLVHVDQLGEAIGYAKTAAEAWSVGHPSSNAKMGPVASDAQWNKIQRLIQSGLDEGATLVTGGSAVQTDLTQVFTFDPRSLPTCATT